MSASVPPVPFSPAPVVQQPVFPAELIGGGALAAMHRDIQARLERVFPAAQFTHRTAPGRFTPAEFDRFTERLPVIGLGWVKMAPVPGRAVRGRIWSGRAEWQVFLVVKNPRVEAQVLGDALGAGLMGLISVATVALHGADIAGIGAAEVGEAGQAYSDGWSKADLAMATLGVSVPFDLVDAAALARMDDFLRLGMRWPGQPDIVADMRDDDGTRLNADDGVMAA